jgi:hypothetical protein
MGARASNRERVRFSATLVLGILLLSLGSGCGKEEIPEYSLADGAYRVSFGQGYAASDEARLLAMTARLDRASSRLVFTLADGTEQVLTFSPRPRSKWMPDCYTMSSHVLDEVADLAPAPLQLESLIFATPIVFAKCGPSRMILASDGGQETTFLALDPG